MIYFKKATGLILVFVMVFIVAGLIILFARGYRPNLKNGSLNSQGILVVNSAPNNAQIYLNNSLSGVTPNNLYLKPGKYEVMVKKEGYNPWKKTFIIKGEIVSRTDSQLFSNNPSLSPLTNRGVIDPVFSPSKEKIIYLMLPEEIQVANQEDGGVFVANTNSQTLGIFKNRQLIIPFSTINPMSNLQKTLFVFSPDERNILVFFYDENQNLLNVKLASLNNSKSEVLDATLSYETLVNKWQLEVDELERKIIEGFSKKISSVLNKDAKVIEISPDKTKILYFAIQNTNLKRVIKNPLIGSVPTIENRNLLSGNYYVYDSKEDKNFQLYIFSEPEKKIILNKINDQITANQSIYTNEINSLFNNIAWYSDSRHLIFQDTDIINIIEYDSQNLTTVYSGPFEKSFNGVTNDGKLIILTNINPKKNKLADIYTVSIK